MLVLNDPTVRLPCRYGHQGAALQCAPAPYLWIHIFQGRLQLLQLLSRQVVEDLILVEVLVFAQVLLVQRHGCVDGELRAPDARQKGNSSSRLSAE